MTSEMLLLCLNFANFSYEHLWVDHEIEFLVVKPSQIQRLNLKKTASIAWVQFLENLTACIQFLHAISINERAKRLVTVADMSALGLGKVPSQPGNLAQKNVEGRASDSSVASKQDFEAQSNKEASSEQNPLESKLDYRNINPFVKQTSKWLASIHVTLAFASEFPTKEISPRLHPAAQSSSSAHVTAGMICIIDITLPYDINLSSKWRQQNMLS
ncbi:hypothetical protein VNO77_41470 [Canavalia gladiata]|uniref:Uncharacterized protein n=1 Tax=Canavalia gladiata TaxID=3824 RepID=A0AAN9JYR1_CANGL